MLLGCGMGLHAWLVREQPGFTRYLQMSALIYGAMMAVVIVQRAKQELAANLHVAPLNWRRGRRMATLGRLAFKLAGLFACMGLIVAGASPLAAVQFDVYRDVAARIPWRLPLGLLAAGLAAVVVLDAFDRRPWDAYYRVGRWLVRGRRLDDAARTQVLFSMVRGFFLFYGLGLLHLHHALTIEAADRAGMGFALGAADGLKVVLGIGSFIVVSRVLDNHPRSVDTRPLSWLATLSCYPPLGVWLFGFAAIVPLPQRSEMAEPALQFLYSGLIGVLTVLYYSDLIAWGDRFSQLSYRGLVRHGPFGHVRHPAYLAKCLLLALTVLPGVSSRQWLAPCGFVLLTCGLYWLRARCEDAHLARYPEYREYRRRRIGQEDAP